MVMSALPPKADSCGATRDVRFGPIADMFKIARGKQKTFDGGVSESQSDVLIRAAVVLANSSRQMILNRDVYATPSQPIAISD